MKKLILSTAAVIIVAMAGGAFATDATTGAVTVNASVSAKCGSISGGSLSLSIDPSTGGEVDSSGTNVTVQCTKSQGFNVSASSAGGGGSASTSGTLSGKLKSTGLNADIPYTLYFTNSFTGAGFGAATPTTILTAAGSGTTGVVVASADAQAAQAGSYSDNVTLTVSY